MQFIRRLSKRSQNVVVGSVSRIGARAIAICLNFFCTSIVVRYLSPNEYGLWAILISFNSCISNLNMGLGNSVRNKMASLSETAGASDAQHGNNQTYFLSVVYWVGFIASVCIILVFIVFRFVGLGNLINSQEPALIRLGNVSIALSLLLLLINLSFSLYEPGFYAYQQTHWLSLIEVLRSFFSTGLLLFLVHIQGPFVSLVVANFGSLLFFSVLGFFFFLTLRKWRFVFLGLKAHFSIVKELMASGILFLVLALSGFIIFMTDTLLVNFISGVSAAGDFSLVQTLFRVIVGLHIMILTPLWSAYTAAAAKGEWNWCRRSLIFSALLTVVYYGIACFLLVLFGNQIVKLWTGRIYGNNLSLRLALGVWAFLYGWLATVCIFLNGLGRIRLEVFLMAIAAAVNIPIALALGYRYGMVGITCGGIVSILPVAISLTIQVGKIFRTEISQEATNHQ